jgi:hypothetical protein
MTSWGGAGGGGGGGGGGPGVNSNFVFQYKQEEYILGMWYIQCEIYVRHMYCTYSGV